MANCVSLSKGRKIACKEGSAGIKAVSFAPFDKAIVFTITAGEVATMPLGITEVFEYETLNDGSSYTETISSDRQTRSTLFTGALNLVLAKFDTDTRNEILMLTKGLVWVFIEDYNGNVFLTGVNEGADLVGGTIATGGARTDLQGFTLNFTSLENAPLCKLSSAAVTTYNSVKVEGL